MIPLESPVPEIGTPGSENGGRKRAHGNRPAARLRKRRIGHRLPIGYAPPLDSTRMLSVPCSGETAACRLRTAAAQLPTRRRTFARPPPVGSDFEQRTVTTTSSPSLKSTSAQQRAATSLRRRGAVEQQGDDRTVDQVAPLGGLRALEAAAGAARAEAGGEDGGALVRR